MTEREGAAPSPSFVANMLAHLLIGLLVVTVTKAIFKQRLMVAIAGGLLAVAAHYKLDAPVAQRLSELGI